MKRNLDKEKLKDYDKTKIQLEQLQEFKARILESQKDLQKELQRAKEEARKALDDKNLHADEMAAVTDTIEMAVLDKEMAEEKVSN